VLDTLQADTRTRLAVLLDQLGRGLSDGGARLRAGFAQIAPFLVVARQMAGDLAERRVQLARLIHNFGGIAQVLALRDRELTGFVREADATLGALARTNAPLSATLQALPPTFGVMETAFARLRAAETTLDPALRSLQPVANALPAGLSALSRFSVAATPALRVLRRPPSADSPPRRRRSTGSPGSRRRASASTTPVSSSTARSR
jgi:ABC-type transporter Mla subunit MlaD